MTIEFTKQEKVILVTKLQKYMSNELDAKLGQFDAVFLLDFISQEMGRTFTISVYMTPNYFSRIKCMIFQRPCLI